MFAGVSGEINMLVEYKSIAPRSYPPFSNDSSKMRAIVLLGLSTPLLASTVDYTKYVNLFIGTEGPKPGSAYSAGNVFPGAALPFGAVKVGIDTTR